MTKVQNNGPESDIDTTALMSKARPTWEEAVEVLDADVVVWFGPVEVDGDALGRRRSAHHAVHQRLDGVAHAPVDEPLVQARQAASPAAPEQHGDAAVRGADEPDALATQPEQLVDLIEVLVDAVGQQALDLAHDRALVVAVRAPHVRRRTHHHCAATNRNRTSCQGRWEAWRQTAR